MTQQFDLMPRELVDAMIDGAEAKLPKAREVVHPRMPLADAIRDRLGNTSGTCSFCGLWPCCCTTGTKEA